MGAMSACCESLSSSVVLSSSFCVRARTTLATSQPTSASTRPPSRRGAYSNSCVAKAENGPETMARSSELNTAMSVSRITTQNRPSATAPSMSTPVPVSLPKRWLTPMKPRLLRVAARTTTAISPAETMSCMAGAS
ncbi:hypothetical protein D9M68_386040 [compost metagenome]